MLQRLWPGNSPVFCNVPNQENRQRPFFRLLKYFKRHLPHLSYTAGGGLQFSRIKCLDGVEDHDLRVKLIENVDHVLDAYFGTDIQVVRQCIQSFSAKFDLLP